MEINTMSDEENEEAPFTEWEVAEEVCDRWWVVVGVILIADMLLPLVTTNLTLDIATPDKPAVALLLHMSDSRLITTTTAQQSTTI